MATPTNGTPATNTPPVDPGAPEMMAAQSAPDLSALTQPGASSQPNYQTAALNSAEQQVNTAASEAQAAQKAAQPPAPAKPVPHAKLLAMVEGLSIGLNAAAKSMATKGKEGGAPEVAEYYAQKQQLELQKLQAQREAQDATVRMHLVASDNALKLGQAYQLLATLPQDLREHDVRLSAEEQQLDSAKQNMAIQLADFQKANWGFTPQEIIGTNSGGAPGAVDPQHIANGKTMLGRLIGPDGAATTILGANDPAIKAVHDAIANPNATPKEIQAAGQGLQFAVQQKQEGTEARLHQEQLEAAGPVARLTTPEALANPGSVEALNAALKDPNLNPVDKVRLQAAIPLAAAAQKRAQNQRIALVKAEQEARMGNPAAAGEQLATYQTTISELKSRGMTPDYVNQAIQSANAYAKAHGAKPDQFGNYYNAVGADNYAKIAGSEANQQLFGNVGSLLAPETGTLALLSKAGSQISQHDWQILNKAKNWKDLATGSGPIAGYAAIALGVADDYSKVMGGGVGSDTARKQVLDSLNPALSPAQRQAAKDGIASAVRSQAESKIGNNPFLRLEYGSLIAGATGTSTLSSTPSADASSVPGIVIH